MMRAQGHCGTAGAGRQQEAAARLAEEGARGRAAPEAGARQHREQQEPLPKQSPEERGRWGEVLASVPPAPAPAARAAQAGHPALGMGAALRRHLLPR